MTKRSDRLLEQPGLWRLLVLAAMVVLLGRPALAQDRLTIKVLESTNAFPEPEALIEVRDAAGRLISDLQPDQITVLQDGRPIAPDQVRVAEQPRGGQGGVGALVLDASQLLGADQVEAARAAAIALLQAQPGAPVDDPEVLTLFVPSGTPRQPSQVPDFATFTYDRNAIINYLNTRLELQPGGTPLYAVAREAIAAVRAQAEQRGTPGYVAILSDGGDQLSADAFGEVLAQARQHNIKLLTMQFGPQGRSTTGAQRLQQLASETGGAFLDRPAPEAVQAAYAQLVEVTPRSAYRVSFTSELPADDEVHSWEILVNIDGVEAESQQILFQAILPPQELRPLSAVMQAYLLRAVPAAVLLCGLLTLAIALWQRMGQEDSRRLRSGLGEATTFKRPNNRL